MSCISTGESHESSYRGVCAMILRENWNTMLFPRLCTTLYPRLGELSTKNRTVGIMWGALHCIPLSASWWWLCDKDSVIQCWNSQAKTSRINLFGFHSEIFIFLALLRISKEYLWRIFTFPLVVVSYGKSWEWNRTKSCIRKWQVKYLYLTMESIRLMKSRNETVTIAYSVVTNVR